MLVDYKFDLEMVIDKYGFSILGLARLFADVVKDNLVFAEDAKKFYFNRGKRWQLDFSKTYHEKEIIAFAEYLLDLLQKETQNETHDEKEKIKMMCLTASLLNPSAWTSFLKAYRLYNFIEYSKFDTNGSGRNDFGLFNCSNGTLNLNTLELLPHNPSDRITMYSDVIYDKSAQCPRWDSFINEITCSDKELAGYLQKLFGYALTALTLHEEMYFLYGKKSRNGKSTLMKAILSVLGLDYGKSMSASSISKKASTDGSKASSDLARHSNSRLVNISEPQQGMSMDALIKIITGQDKIVARYLYKEFFEFTAKFKMFVTANYLPIIKDITLFASGRIVVIPFDRFFDEKSQDSELKNLFQQPENQSAILNWLLEGLRMYKNEGLEKPAAVLEAIEEYKRSADANSLFFIERVEECSNSEVIKRSEFFEDYVKWCGENRFEPLPVGEFNTLLKQKLNVKKLNKGIKGVVEGGFYVIGYKLKSIDTQSPERVT